MLLSKTPPRRSLACAFLKPANIFTILSLCRVVRKVRPFGFADCKKKETPLGRVSQGRLQGEG